MEARVSVGSREAERRRDARMAFKRAEGGLRRDSLKVGIGDVVGIWVLEKYNIE